MDTDSDKKIMDYDDINRIAKDSTFLSFWKNVRSSIDQTPQEITQDNLPIFVAASLLSPKPDPAYAQGALLWAAHKLKDKKLLDYQMLGEAFCLLVHEEWEIIAKKAKIPLSPLNAGENAQRVCQAYYEALITHEDRLEKKYASLNVGWKQQIEEGLADKKVRGRYTASQHNQIISAAIFSAVYETFGALATDQMVNELAVTKFLEKALWEQLANQYLHVDANHFKQTVLDAIRKVEGEETKQPYAALSQMMPRSLGEMANRRKALTWAGLGAAAAFGATAYDQRVSEPTLNPLQNHIALNVENSALTITALEGAAYYLWNFHLSKQLELAAERLSNYVINGQFRTNSQDILKENPKFASR